MTLSTRLLFLFFVATNCVMDAQTLSKDYPYLKRVDAIARISFNLIDHYFYYSYSLKNHIDNKGKIEEFRMDISRKPSTIVYDTIGLKFDTSNGDYEERSFHRNFPRLSSYIVPIGLPILPDYWGSVWGNQLSVSLSNVHEPIAAGVTVDGLTIMSKGLPGIRSYVAEPEFQEVLYFPNIEDTTANLSIAQMDSIREAVNYRGWTIGPTAPPINFNAIVWCDTLLSYLHQSILLDWIKDRHIEQRLDRKLERAKQLLQMAETWPPGSSPLLDETEKALKEDDDECSREYGHEAVHEMPHPPLDEKRLNELGRFRGGQRWDKTERPDDNRRKEQYRDVLYWAAREVLESFVREVEILNRLTEKGLPAVAGKRQYLTSEAYALLKYNAEYLIDQMPEKERK